MKKVSIGFVFFLLINFQDAKAATEPDTAQDPCQSILAECKPHVNVAKGSELCNTCSEKCDRVKAKDACSKSKDKVKATEAFGSISAIYRQCTNVCGKPSPAQ